MIQNLNICYLSLISNAITVLTLSWDTAQDSLLQYFSRFGEVIDCVVMKNAETGNDVNLNLFWSNIETKSLKIIYHVDCFNHIFTGRSRGFGFVTFSDPANVEAVIASCPHTLDGRTIDPKSCNPRSMQKPKRSNYLPKVSKRIIIYARDANSRSFCYQS